jgi:hypothetical protein
MWDLDNLTPYACERNWLRDKSGAHQWLVAVKATFVLADGELLLTEDQPAPLLQPTWRGDPATSSLLVDSDLLATKPGTDVVLDSRAFAPGGRPTKVVDVSLSIARRLKTLRVWGPRTYTRGLLGLSTSESQPFTDQPIHYEWAFGGLDLSPGDPGKGRIDERNPVGRGVAASSQDLLGRPAHTIDHAHDERAGTSPAGFGPISYSWMPRRARAGTYDARWEASRKPLLPDDYDERFGSCAPDDQWCAEPFTGGELVRMVNMTPDGELAFGIPRIPLSFETVFRTGPIRHSAKLSTVFIVPHKRLVSLVWQSALRVPIRDVDYLEFTTVAEDAQ